MGNDKQVLPVSHWLEVVIAFSFTLVMKTLSLQLPSLAGTLSIKSMLHECTKTRHFYFKNSKLCTHHPRRLDLRAFDAHSCSTHPHSEVWLRAWGSSLPSSPVPFPNPANGLGQRPWYQTHFVDILRPGNVSDGNVFVPRCDVQSEIGLTARWWAVSVMRSITVRQWLKWAGRGLRPLIRFEPPAVAWAPLMLMKIWYYPC